MGHKVTAVMAVALRLMLQGRFGAPFLFLR